MTEKQDDVDALLASLTEPTASEAKENRKTPSDADELKTFGERAGTFKIDPRDSHLTGTDKLRKNSEALGVNPEDFTDHLELRKESKRRKRLFIGLGLTVFLLILAYVGYTIVQSNTAQATYTIPSNGTEEQRFLNLYPEAPAPNPSAITKAVITENGLQIPGGYGLTFAGMDFEDLDYQAIQAQDFGPAAVANVEGEWNGTTVYLFKDMAHSKAFKDAWDGKPITVEGSPGAAVMFMELPTGVHAVVAVLNPDSTGYMVVLPRSLNYASAENLANFIRIEKSTADAVTIDPNVVSPANFGNLCKPQYGVSTNTIIGAAEGGQAVNTVAVDFDNETILAMKFSDGGTFKFISNGSKWAAADQETYDATVDAFTAAGTLDDSLTGTKEAREATFDRIASSAEVDTLDSCLTILDKP